MGDAPKKTNNISLVMDDPELTRLDDWAWSKRIRSRAQAIRQLLELGLAADAAGYTQDDGKLKKRPKA